MCACCGAMDEITSHIVRCPSQGRTSLFHTTPSMASKLLLCLLRKRKTIYQVNIQSSQGLPRDIASNVKPLVELQQISYCVLLIDLTGVKPTLPIVDVYSD